MLVARPSGKYICLETNIANIENTAAIPQSSKEEGIVKDALQALESLGYSEKMVASVVSKHFSENIESSEDLIKLVLKEL